MSYQSVVLVGASGNLGKLTIPIFLHSGLKVTALIRKTSEATFPDGIDVVKTDFDLGSLTKILQGKDAVVSFLPIVSLASQAVVIEAAIAAGVKRFIPSEYGSDSTNPAVVAAVPFFEAKKKYIDYLKTKEDFISWTSLVSGPLFDWGLPIGFWGFDIAHKKAQLIDGGKTKFTATNGAQVGRALVATLANPAKTANKLVSVESFTTTQLEVLDVFEKATGSKWERADVPADVLRADAVKLLSEGDLLNGGSKLISALVFGKEGLEDHTHLDTAKWNKELGLPVETVEETVRQTLADLV
ncbi:Ff.00g020650.m01.CDS01 [Fusarium sp. VM40]|nr:Ff.00g020650.m01.CDS01 [Fusarium sp. VM40]